MIVAGKNGSIDISQCEPHELKLIDRKILMALTEDDFFGMKESFTYPLPDIHKIIIVNETVIPKYSNLVSTPDSWKKDELYKIVPPYVSAEPHKNLLPSYEEYTYFLKKKGVTDLETESLLISNFLKYNKNISEDEIKNHIELIYRKLIYIRDAFNADYANHFIKYYTVNFQQDANHNIRHPQIIKYILDDLEKNYTPYTPREKYAVINPSLNISPYQANELQNEARKKYLTDKTYEAFIYHRDKNIPHTAKNYAEFMNVSDPTARDYMQAQGITIENNNDLVASDNQSKIKSLKEKGLNKSQVHREAGISRPTINKHWDNV